LLDKSHLIKYSDLIYFTLNKIFSNYLLASYNTIFFDLNWLAYSFNLLYLSYILYKFFIKSWLTDRIVSFSDSSSLYFIHSFIGFYNYFIIWKDNSCLFSFSLFKLLVKLTFNGYIQLLHRYFIWFSLLIVFSLPISSLILLITKQSVLIWLFNSFIFI
jgi:hypothetical protein